MMEYRAPNVDVAAERLQIVPRRRPTCDGMRNPLSISPSVPELWWLSNGRRGVGAEQKVGNKMSSLHLFFFCGVRQFPRD